MTAAASTAVLMTPAFPARAAVSPTWITEQVNFILSKQLVNGAIRGPGDRINPYFANIAAIGLIHSGNSSGRSGALAWMKWYLAHLNAAGPNVPQYSVFDYVHDPISGAQSPTGDFDSVDSYASTTLNLAYAAFTSGDTLLQSYVSTNIATYESIANLLTYEAPIGVRENAGVNSGLTIAKPSYAVAYTMDNAEVYSGLAEFAALQSLLGRSPQATYYSNWAASTQSAILSSLWNAGNNTWNIAAGNLATSAFYAGGTAQIWPVLYGVVSASDYRAVAGWNQFTAIAPTWYQQVPDSYPWTSVSRAAQLMGHAADATTSLTNIRSRFAPSFTTPSSCGTSPCGEWYCNEAGWFIEAGLH